MSCICITNNSSGIDTDDSYLNIPEVSQETNNRLKNLQQQSKWNPWQARVRTLSKTVKRLSTNISRILVKVPVDCLNVYSNNTDLDLEVNNARPIIIIALMMH